MSPVFEFFDRVEKESWSGEVHVRSAQGHAVIRLSEGRFVWAHRPVDRALERFQKIKWLKTPNSEQLTQIKSWDDLVRALLHLNNDNLEHLIRLLKIDRLEVFFRIFFWTNVELIPEQKPISLPDPVEMGFYSIRNLDRLIVEARNRIEEWPILKEKVGSSKRVFVSVLSQIPPAMVGSAEGTNPYSLEELEIIRNCDGHNSVQDLIKALPYGEFLICRYLFTLWKKGVIRPKDDEGSVVSVVFETSQWTLSQTLSVTLCVAFICMVFGALLLLTPTSQTLSVCNESALKQALEYYRVERKRYPLTLSDLGNFLQPLEELKRFDYILINPETYELSCEQNVIK